MTLRFAIPRLLFASLVLAVVSPGFIRAEDAAPKQPLASFATPQAAFAAFAQAQDAQDWPRAWSCLTPALQDAEAFEALFQLGLRDAKALEKWTRPETEWPKVQPKNEEEQRQFVVSMIKDKPGVYAAVCKLRAEADDPTDWKAPLQKVVVKGDRAQGVVTRYLHSLERKGGQPAVKVSTEYDSPVYFQNGKAGWLLDLQTAAEAAKREAAAP